MESKPSHTHSYVPAKSTFEAYQEFVDENVMYQDATYAALGLAGETGEVVEIIKKLYREYGAEWDYFPIQSQEEFEHLIEELGDVLWYTSRIAGLLGSSLSEVAKLNMEKLRARHSL